MKKISIMLLLGIIVFFMSACEKNDVPQQTIREEKEIIVNNENNSDTQDTTIEDNIDKNEEIKEDTKHTTSEEDMAIVEEMQRLKEEAEIRNANSQDELKIIQQQEFFKTLLPEYDNKNISELKLDISNNLEDLRFILQNKKSTLSDEYEIAFVDSILVTIDEYESNPSQGFKVESGISLEEQQATASILSDVDISNKYVNIMTLTNVVKIMEENNVENFNDFITMEVK